MKVKTSVAIPFINTMETHYSQDSNIMMEYTVYLSLSRLFDCN